MPGNTSPPAEARVLVAAAGDLKRWQSDHIKLSEGRGQCWREQVVRSTALCPPHLPSICMKMEEIWDMDWERSTGSFRMLSRATDWSLALASARRWGQTRKANRLDYWKSAPSSCKTVTQLEMTTMSKVIGSDSVNFGNKWDLATFSLKIGSFVWSHVSLVYLLVLQSNYS